ncbi:MAG: hypothetical protein WAS51_14675 [Ilumatobacteraceae bacterium]
MTPSTGYHFAHRKLTPDEDAKHEYLCLYVERRWRAITDALRGVIVDSCNLAVLDAKSAISRSFLPLIEANVVKREVPGHGTLGTMRDWLSQNHPADLFLIRQWLWRTTRSVWAATRSQAVASDQSLERLLPSAAKATSQLVGRLFGVVIRMTLCREGRNNHSLYRTGVRFYSWYKHFMGEPVVEFRAWMPVVDTFIAEDVRFFNEHKKPAGEQANDYFNRVTAGYWMPFYQSCLLLHVGDNGKEAMKYIQKWYGSELGHVTPDEWSESAKAFDRATDAKGRSLRYSVVARLLSMCGALANEALCGYMSSSTARSATVMQDFGADISGPGQFTVGRA